MINFFGKVSNQIAKISAVFVIYNYVGHKLILSWKLSRSKNLDAKAQRGKELKEKAQKPFAFLSFLAFFASKLSVF